MKDYPKSLTKSVIKKIYDQMIQMEQSIYNIYKSNEYHENIGRGIFCKIRVFNKNIPVLITSYQTIDEGYIESNTGVQISLGKEEDVKKIEFSKGYYINKDFDLTIIAIKDSEEKKVNFLEVDESLYNKEKEHEILYNKETIYIIHYNKQNEISVSYSVINNMKHSHLTCVCNIDSNVNGSPIFNSSNNKLIGIYKQSYKYYSKGILFKFIINKFIKSYIKHINKKVLNKEKAIQKIQNEIDILVKVSKEDCNRKIYFLNSNISISDNNYYELNKLNTEIYINDKKEEFRKFIKPKKEGEYKIKLKFFVNLTNASFMFAGCNYNIKIDFISFNTMNITSMKYMFYYCSNLNVINNLYIFDTENVTDMSGMFYLCENLKRLDLFSFNTKNVTNMSYMFSLCEKLNNLNMFSFNTKNVTNMSCMFYRCKNLKNLDLSSFVTENVVDMSNMFSGSENLNNLDLSSLNTKNVIDMTCMFYECKNLKYLNISSFDTNNVHKANGIFYGCLESLIDSNLSYFKKFNKKVLVEKMINEIDIIIKVNEEDVNKEIYFLDNGYNDYIDFQTISYYKHDKFKELNELNAEIYINNKKYKYIKSFKPETKGKYTIKLKFFINLTYCGFMFSGCSQIECIDFISFNSEYIINMNSMFGECENLKIINFSSFDTKNVIDMGWMFYKCQNLKNLNLSLFDTKNVITMHSMFDGCENLNDLNVSSFDTKNVIDMSWMFSNCLKLKNLNLASFDIRKVDNAKNIFLDCQKNIIDSNFSIFKKYDKNYLSGYTYY